MKLCSEFSLHFMDGWMFFKRRLMLVVDSGVGVGGPRRTTAGAHPRPRWGLPPPDALLNGVGAEPQRSYILVAMPPRGLGRSPN